MTSHPSHRLWAEVVRIGYDLHWPLDTALDLEHHARRRVLAETDRLRRLDPAAPGS
jgi:hypothetical protein